MYLCVYVKILVIWFRKQQNITNKWTPKKFHEYLQTKRKKMAKENCIVQLQQRKEELSKQKTGCFVISGKCCIREHVAISRRFGCGRCFALSDFSLNSIYGNLSRPSQPSLLLKEMDAKICQAICRTFGSRRVDRKL